jgi:DNA-binding LacI/PurR family transcriptional regulator
MQKKNATLKDVARVAGVSTATVARVLHNKGYIANDTKELVVAALQKTGYRMNVVARNLRIQRTASIGHILNCIVPNPFFAHVALGTEQEARKNGWNSLIINVQGDAQLERSGVETFIQQRVDAILFTTPVSEANVRLALDAGIPVVQVERPTSIVTHTVLVDNYSGAIEAVEHLLERGHRRIAFMGNDPANQFYGRYVEMERLAGYRDTLQKHGIPLDESLIILSPYYSLHDAFPGEHYVSIKHLLQSKDRPSAIFVSSDMLATCVLQEIYACQLRIPEDISVIGFDDTYAPYLSPPLTTVQLPMLDIGKAAVELILKQFQAEETSEHDIFHQVRLATRLIVRSSTGFVR